MGNAKEGLRLMVADDERNIRMFMSRFLSRQQDLPIGEIRECINGREALAQAAVFRPDIIITDIIMPGLSGLELIEQLRTVLPDCSFLIISGHDNVSYLKRSLQMEVVDYLLKPIDPQELLSALRLMVSRHEQRERERKRQELLAKRLEESMPRLREQFLLELMRGYAISYEGLEARLAFLGLRFSADSRFILARARRTTSLRPGDGMDERLLTAKMRCEMLGEQQRFYCVSSGEDFIFLLYFPGDMPARAALEEARACCAGLLALLCEATGEQITLSLSETVRGARELPVIWSQAKQALGRQMMQGYGGMAGFSDMRTQPHDSDALLHEVKKITYNIQDYDPEELRRALDAVAARIFPDKAEDSTLNAIKLEIMSIVTASIWRCALVTNNATIGEIDFADLLAMNSLEAIWGWFISKMEYIKKSSTTQEQSRTQGLVVRAVAYLQENYRKDIGVAQLAELLGVSPSYLGTIFRRSMECGIPQYLAQLRMQKAAELLADSSLTISEVAARVGFRDMNYFTKVFKAHFNTLPSKMRG